MVKEEGPIAIALSGGGFRATLFHLGVIRLLHERKKLHLVRFLGSVSGGSILAAHLALHWDLYTRPNDEAFEQAAADLIKFTQKDIRGQIIRRSIWAWLTLFPRFLLPRRMRWTIGNLLQFSLGSVWLFGKAKLQDLREGGRPEVFFNCTSLTTGSACFFTSDSFSWYEKTEPVPGQIEYVERFVSSDETLVSFAVAASSAFPPLFPPVEISYKTLVCSQDKFPKLHRLTDGGVYDNLGINRLLEKVKGAKLLLVSDAEGDFDAEYDKQYAWPVSRNIRASDLLMTRVSSLQLDALASQGAKFVKVGIKDVIEKERKTQKGLTVEQQRAIAKIRTDLDAFSDEEVSALILHGYNVAQFSLCKAGILDEPYSRMNWPRFEKFPENCPNLTATLVKSARRKLRLVAWDGMTLVTAVTLGCLSFVAYEAGSWAYNVAEQNFRAAGAKQVAADAVRLTQKIEKLQAELDKQIKAITTTTFQLCRGPSPTQCPPESKWLDCGRPVGDILAPMCSNFTSTKISQRDGSRCDYSIEQIICSFEIPNIGGNYTCTGACRGGETIIQSGSDLTCINEKKDISQGKISGRRAFDGCWGLHAEISEDLSQIDWHNNTWWNKQRP